MCAPQALHGMLVEQTKATEDITQTKPIRASTVLRIPRALQRTSQTVGRHCCMHASWSVQVNGIQQSISLLALRHAI